MTDGEEKHHLQKQKMTGTKRNTTKSSKKRNEGKRKKVCRLKANNWRKSQKYGGRPQVLTQMKNTYILFL
jgi:hypothetical protein